MIIVAESDDFPREELDRLLKLAGASPDDVPLLGVVKTHERANGVKKALTAAQIKEGQKALMRRIREGGDKVVVSLGGWPTRILLSLPSLNLHDCVGKYFTRDFGVVIPCFSPINLSPVLKARTLETLRFANEYSYNNS